MTFPALNIMLIESVDTFLLLCYLVEFFVFVQLNLFLVQSRYPFCADLKAVELRRNKFIKIDFECCLRLQSRP